MGFSRWVVAFCSLAVLAQGTTATLAVVNARIWTGNHESPWAEALAAAGDRIVAVGSRTDVAPFLGPSTRVVDGNGAMVTPGLIDSHIHLLAFNTAHPEPRIFLRFLRDRHEVAERIVSLGRALPHGAWILGEGWTDPLWGGRLPSRQWLDRLAPDRPVWLVNVDGTIGIANSAAQRLAGIPAGAGVIRGGPMWRVEAAVVNPSRESDDRFVEQTAAALLAAGITSVHHNNSWYDFLVLRQLRAAGRLGVRVYAATPLPAWERLRDYISECGRGDSWMHWGALKGFGAIQERDYYQWVSGASRAGLQVMVHVGTEADIRTLLSVFARVREEQKLPDPRFRLEHAHDMPEDLIPRMARVGAIASWQPPLLAHFDLRTAAGAAPPKNLFAFRALLDAGVRIAFGTDTVPGADYVPPLASIALALERAGPDTRHMSLDEALRAYTVDAAYAEFADGEKGSLAPGKLADFVIFDRDLSMVPVRSIRDSKVRMTVIGGRVVYSIG